MKSGEILPRASLPNLKNVTFTAWRIRTGGSGLEDQAWRVRPWSGLESQAWRVRPGGSRMEGQAS